MIEERHTPENPSFKDRYCVEFWHGEILLAVTGTASPAYEALRAALKPSIETIVSPGYDGEMRRNEVWRAS